MKDTADWGEAWAFSRKADFTAYQQNLVGEKKNDEKEFAQICFLAIGSD